MTKKMGRFRDLLAAAAVCGLLLIPSSSTGIASAPKAPGPGQALTERLKSALLSAPHFRGAEAAPEDLTGRTVLVTFFASWCPPCREEMAELEKLYRSGNAGDFTILAINIYEDFDGYSDAVRLRAYLEKTRPGFTVIGSTPQLLKEFGPVPRIPTLLIFNRHGALVWRFANERGAITGSVSYEGLVARLKELDRG